MCFHRRAVYTCNHHAWGALTESCDVEKAFERGERDKGCDIRWSHGFNTIHVQKKCEECVKNQAAQEYRFGVIKEQIKALNEYLRLIKGVEENEGQEGSADEKGEREENVKSMGDESMSSPDTSASSCSSIDGDSEDTDDTSVSEGGGCEGCDETMEEVRVDPDHQSLKLPQIVAERMATVAEGEMAVQASRSE